LPLAGFQPSHIIKADSAAGFKQETMSKYAPLGAFLRRWKRKNGSADTVELTFADVERIIGALLPQGAATREWWHNHDRTERGFAQSRAWLNAGFEAHPVEGSERVLFRKTDLRSLD